MLGSCEIKSVEIERTMTGAPSTHASEAGGDSPTASTATIAFNQGTFLRGLTPLAYYIVIVLCFKQVLFKML